MWRLLQAKQWYIGGAVFPCVPPWNSHVPSAELIATSTHSKVGENMKIAINFLAAAILSLCIGVAVATPLLATEIIPFPRTPQGPTADFGVDVAYADFKVVGQPDEYGIQQMEYQVVLNVTNLAGIEAKLGSVNFAAAQNITLLKGAMEGGSASGSGGGSGGGSFGTRAEGLWLDDKWLNVTWIPGTHPDGLRAVMTSSGGRADVIRYVGNLPTEIPDLPDNASETGYLIEGIPIIHYYFFNSTENKLSLYDVVYANGTWVNVTGRIRIENPVSSVLSYGTVLQAVTSFGPQNSINSTLPSNQSISQTFFVWSGNGDFNNIWAPHQSRLIQIAGTTTVNNNEAITAFISGNINFYAAAYSYVYDYDKPVNGTFYDTSKMSTSLIAVALTETAGGNYIYNHLLSGNQTLQLDQYGIEAIIVPRS